MKSLLGFVEPDGWVNKNSLKEQMTMLVARWETKNSEALYSRQKIEALLEEVSEKAAMRGIEMRKETDSLREENEQLKRDYAAIQRQETGWLVENGESGEGRRYRTLEQGMPVWTEDHMKALRFARRQDAELFAEEDEQAWAVVEHLWTT